MTEIDGSRLLSDLRQLAEIGKYQTGVDRTAFTAADIEARRWLCGRFEEAGLIAEMDRFATVIGRSRRTGPAVLIGSHTDTVPKGGWLDGALGVVYGLEIARTLTGDADVGPIDVISFQDEEGTFIPCLGAKAFCGLLNENDVATASSADGRRLADVLPLLGASRDAFRLDQDRHCAFLEAHIEQGPRLESAGIGIGVVAGIVGIRRFRITSSGRADHAGTTPMSMRHDAGAAMIRLAHELAEAIPEWGSAETVWNIGKIEFRPGAANVVPAEAEMILEFRDLDVAVLSRIEEAFRETAARHSGRVSVVVESIGSVDPVAMDERLQRVVRDTAHELGETALMMPSGAGHDAMVVGTQIPTMLMFVPSIGGRSHDITENTSDADIIRGCRVMASAVSALFRSRWIGAR